MASQTVESYNGSKEAVEIVHPTDNILSFDQVKRLIANITEIQPIIKDMCLNSCMAYTGPLSAHNTCLYCDELRYNSNGNPHQTFDTIFILFAIQTLMRHPEMATEMGYFSQQLKELLNQLKLGNDIDIFNDIACRYNVLQAAANQDIMEHDILLMLFLMDARSIATRPLTAGSISGYLLILLLARDTRKNLFFLVEFFLGPTKSRMRSHIFMLDFI